MLKFLFVCKFRWSVLTGIFTDVDSPVRWSSSVLTQGYVAMVLIEVELTG